MIIGDRVDCRCIFGLHYGLAKELSRVGIEQLEQNLVLNHQVLQLVYNCTLVTNISFSATRNFVHFMKISIQYNTYQHRIKRRNCYECDPLYSLSPKAQHSQITSDFRELNKRMKRKPYHIPKIQDILLKLEASSLRPLEISTSFILLHCVALG